MLVLLPRNEYPRTRDEIEEIARQDPERWLAFVDRLANILLERSHAVWASPKLLALISQAPELGQRQRNAIEETIKRIQQGLPFDQMAAVALVLTGPQGPGKLSNFEGVEIRRSWHWLAAWTGSFSKGVLLAEDLNDAHLYRWLGRAWGTRLDLTGEYAGEEVDLAVESGGGENTPVLFRSKVEQGYSTLCVVDSDRRPSGSEGSIAVRARTLHTELARNPSFVPCNVVVIDAFTIENICPLGVLREVHRSADFRWLEPMTNRGFFAQPSVDPDVRFVNPCKDQSAASLLQGLNGAALEQVQRAIGTMRRRDPSAPRDDASLLVLNVGKLPVHIVERLEQARQVTRRPGNTRSAADWLGMTLTDGTGKMDDSVKTLAQLVWSWGLHFPARIAARNR